MLRLNANTPARVRWRVEGSLARGTEGWSTNIAPHRTIRRGTCLGTQCNVDRFSTFRRSRSQLVLSDSHWERKSLLSTWCRDWVNSPSPVLSLAREAYPPCLSAEIPWPCPLLQHLFLRNLWSRKPSRMVEGF